IADLPQIHNPVVFDTHNLQVELNGADRVFAGLWILAGNSTVTGLTISHCRLGILVTNSGNNTIEGNYIHANSDTGIVIQSSGNHINNNTLSGNGHFGVALSAASNNDFKGNKIGTDPTGTAAEANGVDGVRITGGAGNTIGTNGRNVI